MAASDEQFRVIIATLSKKNTDASEEFVSLTELCQLLSFSNEYSVPDETSDALSPLLVKLAGEKMIKDIPLLAIRAMTYLCDSSPLSHLFLVRDDAVPVLCEKVMDSGDIDVAEQSLQVLEKISEVRPNACCRAGAVMAVLKFFDFFSTTGQRLALTVVMNICWALTSESMPASLFMDSVPILIDLLYQREDDPIILEIITVSLIGISRGVRRSPVRLAELLERGFIPATFPVLVHSDLSDSTFKLLLRAYARISQGSFDAYQTLLELDIAGVVKDNVAASSSRCRATLELIDALLSSASNKDYQLQSPKGLVENLGKNVVPSLVNLDGADSYICYACLCIVKKLIPLCSSEFLIDLLKSVNISSFLAGALTREDPHVQLLALQTSELILKELSSEFLQSFVKEGVFFSINALLSQDKCVPEPSGSQRVPCLCHSFNKSSQDCKLEKDSVQDLAKNMRSIYFPSKLSHSDRTLSGVFRKLRDFSTKLTNMIKDDVLDRQHDNMFSLLDQIFSTLNGSEPISTFEFVQSGIVKSLAGYLSDSKSLSLEKRIRVLVRLFVSSSEAMVTLVQKLQNGLFELEASLDLKKCSYANDILHVLFYLDKINSYIIDIISENRIEDFANGKLEDLDSLKISVRSVPQIEFFSTKLTKRLDQEMRDSIPTWCKGLMVSYPFVFGFGVRRKFFQLDAFGGLGQQLPPEKFIVSRDKILESASQMTELFSRVSVEVQFKGEIGRGNGPTREFYTLLSHELQDAGTGMWREDSSVLFPRPLNKMKFVTQVRDKFVLLGRTVARALREGRLLDLRFSKAFYKLILGKELEVFDVLSFDLALGRTLIEFTALVARKEYLEYAGHECENLFRGMRIEDLCLDFTLPGYPDFVLGSALKEETVTMQNLKEYVSRVLDATIGSGISYQVEGFEYGFNQLFPMKKLEVFTEEELELLLCGESEHWSVDELVDHVKFDHGYTATSPPMVNLLEIIAEFDEREQRAFLQFVTGAPRLPVGGFGSLNPKLTIVRKDSVEELPSVMTCVNYLKMPPYSSKQVMRQKLIYAITEGQGSFQFS